MTQALTYTSIPGIDLAAARKDIDFPVHREPQFSETHQIVSGFNRVSVLSPANAGKPIPIGEVPVNRPYLPYGETMDWIVKEFEETGIPFKLRTSVINKKNFNLYQEYLFDQTVTPPDGNGISPMVFVHGSYTKGAPLALCMGTYRFICSNGAVVSTGKTTHLSVNSRNWGMLQNKGFHDDFKKALDHYADVSVFYAKLNDVPFSETVDGIFKPKLIPFCIRKKIIGQLEAEGVVTLNVTSDKQDGEKFKSLIEEHFSTPGTITVSSDVSTWDIYNRFTSISSRLSSSDRVMTASKSIDKVFSRLEQAV